MKDGLRSSADGWLGGVLGREAFRLELPGEGGFSAEEARAALVSAPRPSFWYAKVPADRVDRVAALSDAGFRVVDVGVTLEREAGPAPERAGGPRVRPAVPADRAAVLEIAGGCFAYSRFHLDPRVGRKAADAVKRAWAANCLDGKRGDGVLVAEKDGRVAGFLAALAGGGARVIDLIGVARDVQRSGAGEALVNAFVRGSSGALRVGTQAANVPSLRLYEKCGFRAAAAHYVLHAHLEKA